MKILTFLVGGLFIIPIVMFMFLIDLITLSWKFEWEKDLLDEWFSVLDGVSL
jgi:hypothetical protein